MCSSKCETPIRSEDSCTEAARTHAPNDTDRTPGMCSESTVSPFGSTLRSNPRSESAALLTVGENVLRPDVDDLRDHRPLARHDSADPLDRKSTRLLQSQ